MAQPEHDRIGPYQILRLIGLGGMAQVYHAVKRFEGAKVPTALKIPRQHIVMDEAARTSFLREAEIATQMGSHANIVHVFDVGSDKGLPYMAMEYITGVDLAKLRDAMIKAGEHWSESAILWVLANIIQGLKHAWSGTVSGAPLRIVHRDISPSNIMLTYEGYVKIADFGISQRVGKDNSGSIRGKFRYMPVEQLQGRATIASDMYAVGAIAWELIEGKKFRGEHSTQEELMLAAYNGEQPEITRSDISPRLAELVRALLNPNEKARIQTPSDAWARLKACPGVNLVNPDPVHTMLRDFLGDKRSGWTDVDVIVVHPELAATRAAIAAVAENDKQDSSGANLAAEPSNQEFGSPERASAETTRVNRDGPETDAPQRRIKQKADSHKQAATSTLKLEQDHPEPEPTDTAVLPEPVFDPYPIYPAAHRETQPTPSAHQAALGNPAQAAAQDTPASWTQPSAVAQTTPTTGATLSPPASKRKYWVALGLVGLLVGLGMLAAPTLPAARVEHEASRPPTDVNLDTRPPKQKPHGHFETLAPTEPSATPLHVDEKKESVVAHNADVQPEPGKPRTLTLPSKAMKGVDSTAEAPKSPEPPPPRDVKRKPRARVLVRLGVVGELDFRVGSRTRRVAEDMTLQLRAGSKWLAVKRPSASTWHSTKVRLLPGEEYLLRLFAESLDLVPLSGEGSK